MWFRSRILPATSCRLHCTQDSGRRANRYRSQKNQAPHWSISHLPPPSHSTCHASPRPPAPSSPEGKREPFILTSRAAACAKFPSSVDSTANFSPQVPAKHPFPGHTPHYRSTKIPPSYLNVLKSSVLSRLAVQLDNIIDLGRRPWRAPSPSARDLQSAPRDIPCRHTATGTNVPTRSQRSPRFCYQRASCSGRSCGRFADDRGFV